jgi:hypothetical protein
MRSELIRITPEIATAWLTKNMDGQRSVRQNVVEKYARDMKDGNWTTTHQAIAFDGRGRLVDGQHRLRAIEKAGISIESLVVWDVPSSSVDHVDLGASRSVHDVLRINGEQPNKMAISMARFIEDGGKLPGQHHRTLSVFQTRDLLAKHHAALGFVTAHVERHVKGVTTAPVLGSVALAYYHEDHDVLADFLRVLVSGIANKHRSASTVIRLRDWLLQLSGTGNELFRAEVAMKTQRVIKAFVNEEHLSKLYLPSEPCYRFAAKHRNGNLPGQNDHQLPSRH